MKVRSWESHRSVCNSQKKGCILKKRKLCVLCLPILLWFLMTAIWEQREPERAPWPWQEGTRLEVTGTVDQIHTKEKNQTIILKNISISTNDVSDTDEDHFTNSISVDSADTISRIKIQMQHQETVQIGNRICVSGYCQYFTGAQNEGEFDAEQYYTLQKISFCLKKGIILKNNGTVDIIKETCRMLREHAKMVLEKLMEKEEAGVMEAVLLGEKSNLDPEIRSLYQKNGIIHVLAISGLHISMIGMSLFHFLRKRRLGFGSAAFISGILIWFYGMLTGFPVSAIRAVMMFFLFLGAQVLGRTYDIPIAMTVSGVSMLFFQPELLTQSGFLLSYSAVAGVAAASALPETRPSLEALKVSVVSWLMTAPIVAWFYYQLPIYGILLNLLVIPSMSVIVLMGILGLLIGIFSAAAGTFLLAPVHYLLQITFALCRQCGRIPGAQWVTGHPALWKIGIYYLILVLLFEFLIKIGKIDLIKTAFGIILGVGILGYRGSWDWTMTFLNVGQGDGICIQTEKGNIWMMDGGSSTRDRLAQYCLEPYLKYQGVRQVECWMISHFDQDHISGLMEILENYELGPTGKNVNGITVRQILIPDLTLEDEKEKRHMLELAAHCQIPVYQCAKGTELEQDGMYIRVLNPVVHKHYESPNAGSMTLLVSFRDFSALLTGDLEGSGEQQVAEALEENVDVLKVAHHGSRNSSSEDFLEKAGGASAVISCGAGNSYGHPHSELLNRLKRAGYKILRTDQDGMIRFKVKK